MLALKSRGTVLQLRYATIPDPSYSDHHIISSRADDGTHTLLHSRFQIDYLEKVRKSILTGRGAYVVGQGAAQKASQLYVDRSGRLKTSFK
jgi:hypothetical protein